MNTTFRMFPASIRARSAGAVIGAAALLAGLSGQVQAQAGRIVVNHDEFPSSNFGALTAGGSNAATFSQNVARFLDTDSTAGGNVLVYSNNFAYGTNFASALLAAGYTTTSSTVTPFTLANLLTYDAVFLAGGAFSKDDTVLTDYVSSGGGVYIAAGTGDGGPAGEATRWNGFLSSFGLAFSDDASYNGVVGTLPVTGAHAIFSGVSQLYYNNGNTVLDIGNANSTIVQGTAQGIGLIGIYDGVTVVVPGIPEPQTYALMLAGLGALGFVARRRGKA